MEEKEIPGEKDIVSRELFSVLSLLSVEELRDKCKKNGISGYYKLKKIDIIELILSTIEESVNNLKLFKLDELKSLCKQYGLTGYSTMKKEQLIEHLVNWNSLQKNSFKIPTIYKEDPPIESIPVESLPKIVEVVEKDKLSQLLMEKKKLDDEIENLEKEREKKDRLEKERLEMERLDMERLEKELLEKERVEKERVETERVEKELLEKERVEKERVETERVEEESKTEEKETTKKKKIPKSVKTHIWNLYIGPQINEHRCLCCKKSLIKITDFETGHVVSEKDGGSLEITNLRPICAVCNHSMGTMNMIEFVKKYGYYI